MPISPQTVRGTFRRLERQLQSIREQPAPEAVHHFRTAARRMEALLVAVSEGETRGIRKRLHRLRRAAGKLRDLDVQSALLAGVRIGRESELRASLLARLARRRAKREKRFRQALEGGTAGKLEKSLHLLADRLSRAARTASGLGADPGQEALREFALLPLPGAEEARWHEFRKRCKQLRYRAELAPDDARARHVAAALRRAQSALGCWHDWAEAAALAERAAAPHSALVAVLRSQASAKLIFARQVATDVRGELLSCAVAAPRRPVASESAPGWCSRAARPQRAG